MKRATDFPSEIVNEPDHIPPKPFAFDHPPSCLLRGAGRGEGALFRFRISLRPASYPTAIICSRRRGKVGAWTLIEMIGILAVLAILAAVIVPMLVKELDKSVANQEKATLNSLSVALQQSILNTRVIPNETTWYSAVASQLGLGTNDILYNVRQQSHLQPRVFLIDPAQQFGTYAAGPLGLPYSQTNYLTGLTNCNARLMIVSSLGRALPNTISNGICSPGHPEFFSNLWNAVFSDAAWSSWPGNTNDVIVQRINLAPLFVHLFLNKFPNSSTASYNIDGTTTTTVPALGINGYFIEGSILGLFTNSPVGLDTQQVLSRDSSFLFEKGPSDNGVWRGNLSGALLAGGVMNIGDVVQQFLNATPNVNAQNPNGNAQQKLAVDSMLNYISNYNVWAVQYNYNNNGLKSYLTTLQSTMLSSLQGLYSGTYFPTNPSACLQ